MQVTNGQILCNSRYKRINGVDCFVNMENVWTGEPKEGNLLHQIDSYPIISGIDSSVYFDEPDTKISSKSYCVQNAFQSTLSYIDEGFSFDEDCTLSFWGKYHFYDSNVLYNFGIYADFFGLVKDSKKSGIGVYLGNDKWVYTAEITNPDTWNHYCLESFGSNVLLFINGILVGTWSKSGSITCGSSIGIRGYRSKCLYDDLVIIKGEALFTESFELPTGYLLDKEYNGNDLTYKNIMHPYTLTEKKTILPPQIETTGRVLLNMRYAKVKGYDCLVNLSKDTHDDNVRFDYGNSFSETADHIKIIDFRTEQTKFSEKSFYYQGYDYLTTYLDDISSSGISNYTISFWVYCIQFNGSSSQAYYYTDFGAVRYSDNHFSYYYSYNDSEKCVFTFDNSNRLIRGTISEDFHNGWHHFAVTLKDNTLREFYLDGHKLLSYSLYKTASGSVRLGALCYFSYQYVDDIVFIADDILWTEDFDPPTDYLLGPKYTINNEDIIAKNIVYSPVDRNVLFSTNILKVY